MILLWTRNFLLFVVVSMTILLPILVDSAIVNDDNLTDMDMHRASNPRPPFHDDADMLNMVLEISIQQESSFSSKSGGGGGSSLVPCENLSIQELDERLIFMEELKSKQLDYMYGDEDYRKNPYNSVDELKSNIEKVNNNGRKSLVDKMETDDEDINDDDEEDFKKFMKCRELVTSFVHRLSESNKDIYLKTKSLPKLSQVDNDTRKRTLHEVDFRHRNLCK